MFGLLSSRPISKIPNYDRNDSIDLQIKSLLYVFKRLQINKFSSFYKQNPILKKYEFKYIASYSGKDSSAYYDKLDATYNIGSFEDILLDDEYRVMVDYGKNKYRSLCIVSELPSPNLSRPGSPVKGESTLTTNHSADGEAYPTIVDYKDRPVKNFGFIHLPCDNISIDMICNVLAHSPIYAEHASIGFTSRYQYAKESVEDVMASDKNYNHISKMTLTKRQHALIIRKYLTTLAFNVQLSRIYEEYVRQSANTSALLPLPLFLVPTLPRKLASSTNLSRSSSSLTKLESPVVPTSPSSPKSPSSPTNTRTLKSKPSISKMKLNELNTPMMLAPSASSLQEVPEKKIEVQLEIWEKCKNAVNEKVMRERRLLAVQRDQTS